MATAQPFPVSSERRSERRAPSSNHRPIDKPAITISAPYPLLDEGEYLAKCTKASYEWANRYRKWKARLVLDPQNYYTGKAYTGQLCRFFNLGNNPDSPRVGPGSDFRALLVEVHGGQPANSVLDVNIFTGRLYRITVVTVKQNRKGEPIAAANWYSIVRDIHLAKSGHEFG
jgi:hypothetical protein